MKEMYLGETAEVMAIPRQTTEFNQLRDMGLREGRLVDLLHYDPFVSRKIIIKVENSRIAFDAGLAANIVVRPLKTYYEVVKTQANYDMLTGCVNRHSIECIFTREYEKFVLNKIPLSLLIADIDHFKRINDTYGHSVGDGVLKRIVTLFKQLLRRSDCLCRWGGEEFLMLLRGTTVNEALQIAERLRQSVESYIFQPFKESGFVTVSIGCCGLPPYRDKDRLIEITDAALYNAKRSSRNRVNVCEEAL